MGTEQCLKKTWKTCALFESLRLSTMVVFYKRILGVSLLLTIGIASQEAYEQEISIGECPVFALLPFTSRLSDSLNDIWAFLVKLCLVYHYRGTTLYDCCTFTDFRTFVTPFSSTPEQSFLKTWNVMTPINMTSSLQLQPRDWLTVLPRPRQWPWTTLTGATLLLCQSWLMNN